MDVIQSSSSKKQKLEDDDNKSFPTIECLPEELIVKICSNVASDSTIDTMNLKRVSKKFLRICNNDQVLRCSAYPKFPYPKYPWASYEKAREVVNKYLEYKKSLRNAGNPYALFYAGKSNLNKISQDKQNKGLRQLIQAAEGGYTLAQYIAGITLYCWGGGGKQKGIDFLTKIAKASDSMAKTLKEIHAYRCRFSCSNWEREFYENLIRRYEPETTKCTCNGIGRKWFKDYCRGRNCWGNGKDIDSRFICQVCLTEEIVYQFLH